MGKSSIFNQKRANFTDENKIFIREQSDKYQKSTSRDEKTNIIKQVLQYFNIKYAENESKAVRRYFSYIAVKNIPAVTGKYPDTIVRKDMLYSHDHTNIINSNNIERYYRCIDHSCQARYLVKIENSSVSEDLQKEHIPECRQFKKLQNEKNDLHKSMTLTEIYNKAMAKFSEDNGTFQQIKKFMTELAVGTDENPLIKDSLVREVYNKSRKFSVGEKITDDEIANFCLINGEQFFIGHDFQANCETMFFGFEKAIQFAKEATDLFCDGTFKITPKHFQKGQMLTIMICEPSTNQYLPLLFIFMKNRTFESYKKAFEYIFTVKGIQFSKLIQIHCDFEKGMIEALQQIFPKVRIIGCLFHFKQALHRKLVALYTKNFNTLQNSLFKLYSITPFMSHEEFVLTMHIINQNKVDSIKDYIDYFNKVWLPHYNLISQYNNATAIFTNDCLESMHSEFSSLKHPNIYEAIKKISQIQLDKYNAIKNNQKIERHIKTVITDSYKNYILDCFQKELEKTIFSIKQYNVSDLSLAQNEISPYGSIESSSLFENIPVHDADILKSIDLTDKDTMITKFINEKREKIMALFNETLNHPDFNSSTPIQTNFEQADTNQGSDAPIRSENSNIADSTDLEPENQNHPSTNQMSSNLEHKLDLLDHIEKQLSKMRSLLGILPTTNAIVGPSKQVSVNSKQNSEKNKKKSSITTKSNNKKQNSSDNPPKRKAPISERILSDNNLYFQVHRKRSKSKRSTSTEKKN